VIGLGGVLSRQGSGSRRRENGSGSALNERTLSVPCANRDYRNSDMRVAEVRQFCKLDEAGDSLVRAAMSQLNLSARGYHRVLKLALTIAELAGSE
jgi:predicted ATPase with chaperone activity